MIVTSAVPGGTGVFWATITRQFLPGYFQTRLTALIYIGRVSAPVVPGGTLYTVLEMISAVPSGTSVLGTRIPGSSCRAIFIRA